MDADGDTDATPAFFDADGAADLVGAAGLADANRRWCDATSSVVLDESSPGLGEDGFPSKSVQEK